MFNNPTQIIDTKYGKTHLIIQDMQLGLEVKIEWTDLKVREEINIWNRNFFTLTNKGYEWTSLCLSRQEKKNKIIYDEILNIVNDWAAQNKKWLQDTYKELLKEKIQDIQKSVDDAIDNLKLHKRHLKQILKTPKKLPWR